ncbi:MAG TPA: ISL3 family transposase [Sporichthyaceae bacterium]
MGLLRLCGRVRATRGGCTGCGVISRRVHSRYVRTLADAPIAGQRVELALRVRRFFCDNSGCEKKTFAEQVPELTAPHARRTGLLRRMLEAVGLALAGRAGARLAARLGIVVGRDALLRLVKALPTPLLGPVPVLGVDDFALRRGHRYGSVLVDMATHRPVDVLADREVDTFAGWLSAHPGTEVICRDRAGAYAEGARLGAPGAVQVADRWHLWHNLAEHVENTVRAHRGCLRASATPVRGVDDAGDADEDAEPVVVPTRELPIMTRTRERHRVISERAAAGVSMSAIARELGLDRATVRRFVRAENLDELLVKTRQRASLLDGFTDYLHHRWAQGVRDAAALTGELRELGYRGSDQTVRRYLAPLRDGRAAPPARPLAPTVREVTGWLLRPSAALEESQRVRLKQVLANCPELEATAGHVRGFAEMMTQRRGDRLEDWLTAVEADTSQPELARFARGLRRDQAAVTAGLTHEHSSGAVEGAVNRIKMLKRQMFGRAGFDLLRTRILLA